MVKKQLLFILVLLVTLLPTVACAGDPVLDDIYFTDIWGDDATFNTLTVGGVPVAGGISPTVFNAKGDLVSASADDTPLILSVGVDGRYLRANSASATGLEWVVVAGGGDVVGPGGATNEAIARYDTGTGKLIQDSPGVTIDDANNLTTTGSITGASYVGIDADMVEVEELGVATYDDVQDFMNFFGDRTLITGGGITDNGDGTATVAAGTAWAKVSDSDAAIGRFFDFSEDASVSLTDLVTNHVYVDYNGGTPQIVVSTAVLTHGLKQDHILIGHIFRNGTTLHLHQEDKLGIGRMGRINMHHLEQDGVERSSGMVISEVGTRKLSVTAGVLYDGISRHITNAFDTNVADTFSYWYTSDGGASWTEVTGATQISSTQYNNIASGLSGLGANRYGVHWVYMDMDGEDLHVVYGQGNYKANEAEEAGVPSILPDLVVNYCVLIAKIILQEGTDTLTITYPWTTVFRSSLATDHGSLAGLLDDDHTQYMKSFTELDGSVSTTAFFQGATDGVWIDWDLSGTLPVGTVAVDIMISKLVATDDVGARTNGSALARDIPALKLQVVIVAVEVAADRIIEIMSNDVSDSDTFSVMGYWQ